MMTRLYTFLGWLAWQGATILIKRMIAKNRAKLGAAGVVLGVLVAGALAAKSGSDD